MCLKTNSLFWLCSYSHPPKFFSNTIQFQFVSLQFFSETGINSEGIISLIIFALREKWQNMKLNINLEYDKIIYTLERLEKRISDRFPDSGLQKVVHDFYEIAGKSKNNIEWISRPHYLMRALSYFVILLAVGGIFFSFTQIDYNSDIFTLSNIITTSEAFFNEIVLIGAAIFFLITIETRVKRNKTSKFLNELRVIAHVIDMHQLTKDPGMHDDYGKNTENSPKRVLSPFELHRYLDYCSEALSLVGKVAALYAQSLPNEVVVKTVNEIEDLSSGLSRKIWQKLIILNEMIARKKREEEKNDRKKVSKKRKQ